MRELPINIIEKNYLWLKKYYKNLLIIKQDTQDILNDFDIYFAVDCVDILLYLFPYLNIDNEREIQSSDEDYLARKQLTRYFLFDHMYYSQRTILPPHLFELNSFFYKFNEFINKILLNVDKKNDLIKILESINSSDNVKKSIKALINQYKHINYLVMACTQPINGKGMSEKMSKKFLKIEEIDDNLAKETIAEIIDMDNEKFEQYFEGRRRNKTLQNYIDAKSLQLCDEMNKNTKSKNRFYIVSSAHIYSDLYSTNPDLPIRPLDVFTTYISITSEFNPRDFNSTNQYHKNVLNIVNQGIEEIQPLLEALRSYQNLKLNCNVLDQDSNNEQDKCDNCEYKNDTCDKLIRVSEKIINHKEKIENVKYILGGVLPFDAEMKSRVKLDSEIQKKLKVIIENLKIGGNDFLINIKNQFMIENEFDILNFLTLMRISENNNKNNIIIKIPDAHIYLSEFIIGFIKKNKDLSSESKNNIFEIFDKIKSNKKEEIIKNIQNLAIDACNSDKLEVTIYLQLIIYYLCGQDNIILNIFKSEKYQNLFNDKNCKEYKPEYYFLYALILHQKIFNERYSIFKDGDLKYYIIEFFKSVNLYECNDPRFKFQKALMLAIIYEQSVNCKSTILKNFIIDVTGKYYTFAQVESLFTEVKDLLNVDVNYPYLGKRIINNICYVRALTSKKKDISKLMDAKDKMEKKFDLPKSIEEINPAYIDTYALVLQKIGMFNDNSNYLLIAEEYFDKISKRKDIDDNARYEANKSIADIKKILQEKNKNT